MTFATIPVRCCTCYRVRLDDVWRDHPGKLPNEVEGYCDLHGGKRAEVRAKSDSWRKYNKVERKKAKGFGPAPKNVNPFR